MNVLSLFDGMSCGQIALNRIGITPNKYYAAEIDKYAIKVAKDNYPNTIHLGDVTEWRQWDIDWSTIDLLIGGSPCQGFSFAGKQLAFDDPRSKLFFVFLDILNHIKTVNPKVKFMLENVKMKKEYLSVISSQLNVEPVLINSALVSAQNRQRYYWCNWKIEQPKDRGINVIDILDLNHNKYNSDGWHNWFSKNAEYQIGKKYSAICNNNSIEKAICMTARQFANWNGNLVQLGKNKYRFLTTIECERLQTLPQGYTKAVSNTQRYKMLGNGWTVDVIAHIFKSLFTQTKEG